MTNGPQHAYKKQGLGGVWRWAKGHGIKRWLKARNWARRRAKQAKDPKGFKKAEAAYARKIKHLRDHPDHGSPSKYGEHFKVIDGHDVPKWIARIDEDARASGIWKGQVISGFRTPAYSTQLCEDMCGAPSCPGRCAGAASNHACPPDGKGTEYEGAEDVTDPEGLEAFCRSHNKPLYGAGYALPADTNHFSHTGR